MFIFFILTLASLTTLSIPRFCPSSIPRFPPSSIPQVPANSFFKSQQTRCFLNPNKQNPQIPTYRIPKPQLTASPNPNLQNPQIPTWETCKSQHSRLIFRRSFPKSQLKSPPNPTGTQFLWKIKTNSLGKYGK